MPQLFFKKPFQEAIRCGRKRTTIRRWDRALLRAGQLAFSPGLGWLAVDAVDAIELDELGDRDTQLDGFGSASDMRQGLQALYAGHLNDSKCWFRIQFHLESRLERHRSKPAGAAAHK